MQKPVWGWMLAALLLAFAACGGQGEKAQEQSAAPVNEYSLRGEITKLDEATRVATIDHEEIVGWMGAMTMAFPVRDEAEFKQLSVGDRITATVYVQDLDYYIGNIRKQTGTPDAQQK